MWRRGERRNVEDLLGFLPPFALDLDIVVVVVVVVSAVVVSPKGILKTALGDEKFDVEFFDTQSHLKDGFG